MDTLEFIRENKLIAIMRGMARENIVNTADALLKGGVRLIEVTFDQKGDPKNTSTAIRTLIETFGDKLCVGAGTVITLDQLHMAHEAGAKYIISPDTNLEIIRQTKQLGLVSMPGAMTPSEISSAYAAGADIIKLFPAGTLGVGYIKAVRAPLSHIPLAAVGGVSIDNIESFISAGIHCFGIGSNIVDKKLIDQGQFDKITELAAAYMSKLK